jgi:hypothetical protein
MYFLTIAIEVLTKLCDRVTFPDTMKPIVAVLSFSWTANARIESGRRIAPYKTDMDALAEFYMRKGGRASGYSDDLFGHGNEGKP